MKIHPILAVGVLATATVSHQGWALGLGELTLYSYLNEPFRAEVELLEASALDDSDVHVGLASDAEFERLGVSREFFLTRIDFVIESDESERRIVLTTEAPLREPYLDLVIEARWPDGRLLREYTVLIDLPPRQTAAASTALDSQRGMAVVKTDRSEAVDDMNEAIADRKYDAAVSPEPAPGGEYLVTSNDTLWRIASEGAADGVSIEQTMLEIVAANPEAFQGGNINGLKSGYVLQIPGPQDIGVDLAAALDEVSIQNEEWAQGTPRSTQGLTLVADNMSEPDVATELDAAGDAAASPPVLDALDVGADAEASSASLNPPSNAEFEALSSTVARLQSSVQSLQAQLADRDQELASLRATLAAQPSAAAAPVIIESTPSPTPQTVTKSQPTPLWPFLAGLLVLITGVAAIIWRRRSVTEGTPDYEASEPIVVPQNHQEVTTSRLSDPQIMASKAVEEAQIYIAYGRTDQAVEVLSDALAGGLSSPTLNMCLLECYVELEQYAEAGALLSRLEQAESPELLSRARQMLLDAGVTLTSSAKSEADAIQYETAVDSEEASVLSEFSFSTDPTFDLLEEPLPEGGMDVVDGDGLSDPEAGGIKVDPEERSAMTLDDGVDELALDDSLLEAAPFDAEERSSGEREPLTAGLTADPDEHGLELSPVGAVEQAWVDEATADLSDTGDLVGELSDAPNTSGLSLAPMDGDVDLPDQSAAQAASTDESIYGAETDPVDSKLDLARAYIDMGDEDGARPVLMDVIKEGDLAQQAEARELLLRLEAS